LKCRLISLSFGYVQLIFIPMNTLEIFLMSVLAGSIFTLFVPPAKRMKGMHALPALAMLLVLLHLILDGYRWQVLSLYLLAAGLFLATFKNSYGLLMGVEDNRPGRDRRGLRIIGAVFSILVLLTAGFIDHIFPMMLLPAPTGAYAVGTTTLYMNDTSRREILTDDPEDTHELMVQVWYPAAGKGEKELEDKGIRKEKPAPLVAEKKRNILEKMKKQGLWKEILRKKCRTLTRYRQQKSYMKT
jgi:hypothetical protein